jgi:hypothetical protein
MTRRHADFSRPRDRGLTPADAIMLTVAGTMLLVFILLALALLLSPPARAHDIWIGRGGLRNSAGEWCCGVGDCGVMASGSVTATADGYRVRGWAIYGAGATGDEADGESRFDWIDELVPYSQAMPSPDGAYWRCRKPSGEMRCFFAPPPGS